MVLRPGPIRRVLLASAVLYLVGPVAAIAASETDVSLTLVSRSGRQQEVAVREIECGPQAGCEGYVFWGPGIGLKRAGVVRPGERVRFYWNRGRPSRQHPRLPTPKRLLRTTSERLQGGADRPEECRRLFPVHSAFPGWALDCKSETGLLFAQQQRRGRAIDAGGRFIPPRWSPRNPGQLDKASRHDIHPHSALLGQSASSGLRLHRSRNRSATAASWGRPTRSFRDAR